MVGRGQGWGVLRAALRRCSLALDQTPGSGSLAWAYASLRGAAQRRRSNPGSVHIPGLLRRFAPRNDAPFAARPPPLTPPHHALRAWGEGNPAAGAGYEETYSMPTLVGLWCVAGFLLVAVVAAALGRARAANAVVYGATGLVALAAL